MPLEQRTQLPLAQDGARAAWGISPDTAPVGESDGGRRLTQGDEKAPSLFFLAGQRRTVTMEPAGVSSPRETKRGKDGLVAQGPRHRTTVHQKAESEIGHRLWRRLGPYGLRREARQHEWNPGNTGYRELRPTSASAPVLLYSGPESDNEPGNQELASLYDQRTPGRHGPPRHFLSEALQGTMPIPMAVEAPFRDLRRMRGRTACHLRGYTATVHDASIYEARENPADDLTEQLYEYNTLRLPR
ncbi:hypothetical protein PVAR5_2018 [Paecilomyces variotii No. 5]|uniref:Uncharacterized protein n=1 Tax=Byssochlamys spectabilis (strain No. 5 / NBRC 109023) TaxID=1356009 RepID=V5FNC7_BYSSN|nr:hypothetical protein PVAR5_2018 [Paecilomyces variotii No. 5]